jgi:putative oxidoreductase
MEELMLKSLIAFFGRLFISLLFLADALNKVFDWQATELMVHTALTDWLGFTLGLPFIQNILEMAIPFVPMLVALAFICELLGGLCILLGVQVRFGAFLLILFLIPTTLLMHHFWTLQGLERETQLALFLKDVSILGGLLILLAYGKGQRPQKREDAPKQ